LVIIRNIFKLDVCVVHIAMLKYLFDFDCNLFDFINVEPAIAFMFIILFHKIHIEGDPVC
jgi:hypothetical protein